MNRDQIHALTRVLPPDSPYFRMLGEPGSSPDLIRVEWALNDPAFGANVALSYGRAGVALPEASWPTAVLRAYRYWSGQVLDTGLLQVEVWSLPENFDLRLGVQALLLCQDVSYETMALWLDCEPEAPALFHELAFNVRGRDEPLYLRRLVEKVRQEGETLQERCQANWAGELLQLAIRTRSAQDVLQKLEIPAPPLAPIGPEQLLQQISGELAELAAHETYSSSAGPRQNPALALALKYHLVDRAERRVESQLGVELNRSDLQPLRDDLVARLAKVGIATQPVPPP